MTTFDKREDAFEKKFAHDEELQFKAAARRNKLLGLWAAEKMGIAGDADVLAKVLADLKAAGVEQSEHQIRRTMDELMVTAIEQIKSAG